MSEWDDALDALEEWVRRTAEGLAGPTPQRPDTPPVLPAGPAPEQVRLRVQSLVETIHQVEAAVLHKREQLRREQAYGAA